jgi:hypothetical protein
MDKIIFGDNQFFGINHMSEAKASECGMRFRDLNSIIKIIDAAYDSGIHAFMFSTHDRVSAICDHFRSNPKHYSDLRLYPILPYAHKYANAVAEKGIVGALVDCLAVKNSTRNLVSMITHGGLVALKQDPFEVMRLLVDAEMKIFHGLNVKVVFLQNIVTDLLLGYGIEEVFVNYSTYVRERYGAEPGFITLNLPKLAYFLDKCSVKNPVICSAVNRIGYLMNPGIVECEKIIKRCNAKLMAMCILGGGAVQPQDAIDYVVGLGKVDSIVFGASSVSHIQQTKGMIDRAWGEV